METYDITDAGVSAEEDRQKRMKTYFIMMAIRMACVVSLLWVRGPWIIVAALGAVFLPYFAVVLANEPDNRNKKREKLAALQLESAEKVNPAATDRPIIIIETPEDSPTNEADTN